MAFDVSTRNTKLLQERPHSYVVLVSDEQGNTRVTTLPKTDYTAVKYGMFKGGRISYKFTDDIYVEETYDNGVFNCYLKGLHVQVRNEPIVMQAIIDHTKNQSIHKFISELTDTYNQLHRWDMLEYLITSFADRVKVYKDIDSLDVFSYGGGSPRLQPAPTNGIVTIDDVWVIDSLGNAYFKTNEDIMPDKEKYSKKLIQEANGVPCRRCGRIIGHRTYAYKDLKDSEGEGIVMATSPYLHLSCLDKNQEGYKRVCLVAEKVAPYTVVTTPMGDMILDTKMQEILGKITFLLNPNFNDEVFAQQLSKALRMKYKLPPSPAS